MPVQDAWTPETFGRTQLGTSSWVMTVAARTLPGSSWEFMKLPQKLKWDSHNYVTMAADDSDRIHLSGNMHNVPLVYFRMERPMDIGLPLSSLVVSVNVSSVTSQCRGRFNASGPDADVANPFPSAM